MQEAGVRFFCYIGGNDSMDTAHQVHLAAREIGYELRAIGVPKTVDNDLAYTDHCPGYGSAARFVALAVRDSGRDTESMGPSSPVKVIEVMGRNAGWLTAAAALGRQEPGDPPHLIYVPERPADGGSVIQAVDRVVGERDHYEYIGRGGDDVTLAFLDYARPLIGEPLPRLGRLVGYPVPHRRGET